MDNEQELIQKFENLLIQSLKKLIKNKKIAIAFSGGVDSCVLAKLIKQLEIETTAYVIGIENSKDFESAEKAAGEIGIELKKIILTKQEIENSIPIQIKILQELYKENKDKSNSDLTSLKPNPVSVSFYLPLFFVAKYSNKEYIITGQGADELLGGYAKYLKLSKTEAMKKINKDAEDLIKINYLRDKKTAENFNKQVLMPYLDEEVVKFCLSLSYEMKINNSQRKYILRKLAEKIGLSKEISYKKKKAAQYGSGIMKTMKKIAKEKGLNLNTYIGNFIE